MNKATRMIKELGPLTLIMLGSLWLLQAAIAHTSGHGVIVRGLSYDAGTVKPGTVISHSLRVVNLSGQRVDVDAHPSCGCTVVETPDAAVGPLSQGIVKAQVDTDGMRKGAQEKVVTLQFHTPGMDWRLPALIKFRLQ